MRSIETALTKLTCARQLLVSRLLGRRRPIFVGFDVTNRCNLRCEYCGRDILDKEELGTEEALALLGRLCAAGTRVLVAGGGEPLVREDLPHLLRVLGQRGVFRGIDTNGWFLAERPEVVACCELVKVSYDGPAEVHDAQRGPGSHARALSGIEAVRRQGVLVKLNCTLTPQTIEHLDEILAFCRREGLGIKFQPAGDAHAGARDISGKRPSAEQLAPAIDRLRAEKRDRRTPVLNSRAALDYISGWPEPQPYMSCVAGWAYCRVDPAGRMYPCTMMQFVAPHVSIGDHPVSTMEQTTPGGCRTCWCTSVLELNLMTNGRLLSMARERAALWRRS